MQHLAKPSETEQSARSVPHASALRSSVQRADHGDQALAFISPEETREFTAAIIRSPLRWLLASHPRLEMLIQRVGQAAESSSPVLIEGETGTGKELVARTIHQLSARRDQPFIAATCSAKSEVAMEDAVLGDDRLEGTMDVVHVRRITLQ